MLVRLNNITPPGWQCRLRATFARTCCAYGSASGASDSSTAHQCAADEAVVTCEASAASMSPAAKRLPSLCTLSSAPIGALIMTGCNGEPLNALSGQGDSDVAIPTGTRLDSDWIQKKSPFVLLTWWSWWTWHLGVVSFYCCGAPRASPGVGRLLGFDQFRTDGKHLD